MQIWRNKAMVDLILNITYLLLLINYILSLVGLFKLINYFLNKHGIKMSNQLINLILVINVILIFSFTCVLGLSYSHSKLLRLNISVIFLLFSLLICSLHLKIKVNKLMVIKEL